MRNRVFVQMRCTISSTPVSMVTYQGRDHLQIPVVAMVGDIIVTPISSGRREFVPASVLAKLPESWNGRPVTLDHPASLESANTPDNLDTIAFGQIFHARFEDNRLRMDPYIDLEAANNLGEDAQDLVAAAQAGDPVEVSVGGWIRFAGESGIHNGEKYDDRWEDVHSDHLAFLPLGKTGACSVEAGCGAPRVYAAHEGLPPSSEEGQASDLSLLPLTKENPVKSNDMLSRFLSSMKGLISNMEGGVLSDEADGLRSQIREFAEGFYAGLSDRNIAVRLIRALKAEVGSNFEWLDAVYQSDGQVVYTQWESGKGFVTYRRGFEMGDNNTVTLSDDIEEVMPVDTFEPVSAAEASTNEPAETGPCSCNKETEMSQNEAIQGLVDQLVSAESAAPFTEDQAKALSAFSEEQLKDLVAKYATDDDADPPPPADPAPQPTQNEATREIPESEYQRMLAATTAQEKAVEEERQGFIKAILASPAGKSAYTAETLADKTIEDLQPIAKMAGLTFVDHSVRPVVNSPANLAQSGGEEFDSYAKARERRKQQQAN